MNDTRVSIEEVKKLAALARISITDEEAMERAKDLDQILGYVSLIEKAPTAEPTDRYISPLANVFREDGEPHDPQEFREAIMANFPHRNGDYLVVKEVISYQ